METAKTEPGKARTGLRGARLICTALVAVLLVATVVVCLARMRSGRRGVPLDSRSLSRIQEFPGIVLWAWERPEDLSFIDTRKVGVAFLAETIHLKGNQVIVQPRLQPLKLPPETKIMAVARIEVDRSKSPALSEAQIEKAALSIANLAQIHDVSAIQIDFDAKTSARPFYRELLLDVRRRLPREVPLSITALASWCIYDNWLSDLPVDEAVPMLFRMGADTKQVLMHFESGGDFHTRPAMHSLGISVDEPIANLPAGRRVYVFNPKPWSQADLTTVISEVTEWH
jgi:hypothetical protein